MVLKLRDLEIHAKLSKKYILYNYSEKSRHFAYTVDPCHKRWVGFRNAYQRNQLIATLCAKTMDYRGLGSGIIRALQSDDNIEFRNEVSGDQFRVILWRSDLKSSEKTTQKTEYEEESTQKTTQKTEDNEASDLNSSEKTTQKTEDNEASDLNGSEKTTQKTEYEEESTQKTTQKIITLISENPNISRKKLAEACEVTPDAIKLQIRKLREAGKIRRVGPDKGGHWEICD